MSLLRLCFFKTEDESAAPSSPLLSHYFQPTLGRIGLFGILISLAVGAFAPVAEAATLGELRFDRHVLLDPLYTPV